MSNDTKEKVIPQPDITIPLPLVTSTGSIKGHAGVTFVAGEGVAPSDIMFIGPSVSIQEASKYLRSQDGSQGSKVQPRYLRSDAGVMFTDIFDQEGISVHKFYYTALIKWLLPKTERTKLNKDYVSWAMPSLEEEIALVKPKIIVCIGKQVFDLFSGVRLSVADAKGGWFYNEKFNARVYLLEDTYKLVTNPEYIEKFRTDAREINRTYKEINNIDVGRVPLDYKTIVNSEGIKELLSIWREGEFKVISVDCEWAGNNHIDGKLRSTQFCWAPGKACYIRWMDDKGNYVFDKSYAEIGKMLSTWLDREDVKYIGHHFAADAPWLHHVLGLNWYEKCIFDSEFAQQTANENEDLSLERIAMKYTDLGRYDLQLNLWVKQNKASMVDGGYGAIPDELLIPYAQCDVDVVFRAWPVIRRSLEAQSLTDYYDHIFNPFVTDVFTSFALEGLPMDVHMMDELRILYSFARDKMAVLLKEEIHADAKLLIFKTFISVAGPGPGITLYNEFLFNMSQSDHEAAWNMLKRVAVKPDDVPRLKYLFEHYVDSADFNIRSSTHLKRWLFHVKGYEPIKSTNNKEKGLPSTSWEKVKGLPPEARKNYNPAVDKQTLQILSEQHDDALLRRLLQLNAVGNICKAFLKEADVDEEGNLVKENGLHFFLCSDNKIHGQYSTTETGRPRCVRGDTLIKCIDGYKPIKDIIVGDKVWTHRYRYREVEATYTKPVSQMYEVCFDNGEVLRCTEEHLLLTEDEKWISIRDVCLQKAFKRSGTAEESHLSLPRVIEHRRAGSERSGYNAAYRLSHSACGAGRGGIQEIKGLEVLELENGGKESLEKQDRSFVCELERRCRRWLRIFNTPSGWDTVFRASNCDSGSLGVTSFTSSGAYGSTSHRSGPEEQRPKQSGFMYKRRSSVYPRPIQKHRTGNKITRIVPCGSYPVYDITVKEDHSYESAGCFSHNSWKPNSLNWPSHVNKMISSGIADLFGKLKDRGELPEAFEKYLAKNEKDEYECLVPSIRSCVKAPEGYCFVESDYQTAEIRGLGFVSGDSNLIDIICKPDENFALTVDEKKVRLAFPDERTIPRSNQEKYAYLLTDKSDSSLLRNSEGQLVHPKQDLHWSLAEMVHGKPREVLDEKKDRSAAKVGNFCIAEDELVLTHTGWKPIQHILGCDLLWDGVEWVRHEGVVYSGEKEVIEYQGLAATKLHDVWTLERGKIKFGEASAQQLNLVRSEETCRDFEYIKLADISGHSEEKRQRLLLRFDKMRSLRRGKMERSKKYGERIIAKMPLPAFAAYNFRSTGCIEASTENTRISLPGYETEMRKRHTCLISEVQRPWNSSGVCFAPRLLFMGSTDMASGDFRKERFRQDRQFGKLLQEQSQSSGSNNEYAEQRLYARNSYRPCQAVYGAASKSKIYGENYFGSTSLWSYGRGDTTETHGKPACRMAKVYDIINAGPRNRFTCQGMLVSNSSAYGASPSTLERKIEQETGKKPAEGTGDSILKSLERRQPVAFDFLVKMERLPQKTGYYRAASGRIRHFENHGEKYMKTLDEDLLSGMFKSMGREARCFPMQESVAATAARAGKWLLDTYRRKGLKAIPLTILYDSVVTLCPLEERFAVAELHQKYMTDINTWEYHGRKMNYPIDTLFCYRWSAKPTKAETAQLNDKTWKV